jgi:hypothetical protein
MLREETGPTGAVWTFGTVNVLHSEAERLDSAARVFDEFATELRRTDPDSWSGGGRDAFAACRDKQATQLTRAADAHHSASKALETHVSTLTELSRKWQGESNPVVLARLTAQRTDAARDAAEALDKAADDLAEFRSTLSDTATAVAGGLPELPLIRRPAPPAVREREALDPRLMHQDRESYDRDLQQLNDSVLRYWSNGARPEGG